MLSFSLRGLILAVVVLCGLWLLAEAFSENGGIWGFRRESSAYTGGSDALSAVFNKLSPSST